MLTLSGCSHPKVSLYTQIWRIFVAKSGRAEIFVNAVLGTCILKILAKTLLYIPLSHKIRCLYRFLFLPEWSPAQRPSHGNHPGRSKVPDCPGVRSGHDGQCPESGQWDLTGCCGSKCKSHWPKARHSEARHAETLQRGSEENYKLVSFVLKVSGIPILLKNRWKVYQSVHWSPPPSSLAIIIEL